MSPNATALTCCRQCGAVLSQYRAAGETLCAPCTRTAADQALEPRTLEPDRLADACAGLLLLTRGLNPGRRIHLRAQLQTLGVIADHVDVRHAVLKLASRHGMRIDSPPPPQCGHRLDHWPHLGKLETAYRRLTRDG